MSYSKDKRKQLPQLKLGVKRTIYLNTYLSKKDSETESIQYLDFLIGSDFQGAVTFFMFSFSSNNDIRIIEQDKNMVILQACSTS